MDTTNLIPNLLEILKYVVPSLVVMATAYYIVNKFLVNDTQRKQMALMHETHAVTIPLRLQAYERLTIFIERVNPRQLLPRVYEQGMTVGIFRQALMITINTEFEHNLSQQIYVSRNVWETVRHVKEQEMAMINQIAEQLNQDDAARMLHVKIIDYMASADGEFPGDIALQVIAEEAKTVLSYIG